MSPTTRTTPAINQNDYDIAVIGAGPAGVAAAAAAGNVARVILIDAAPRLGGSVSAAMHRSMCGLYAQAPSNPRETLNAGVQRDLVSRMLEKNPAAVQPKQMGKAWVLEFPTNIWEESLAEICAQSEADLHLGSRVTEVRRQADRISAICVSNASTEPKWIEIKAIVDCTGGGHILKLAGHDTYHPPEMPMLAGFAIRLTGIAGDPELLRLQIPYFLTQAVEQNRLPKTARYTSFYPGPGAGEGVCKLAIDLTQTTATQANSLADQLVIYLKNEIPALATARVLEKSPDILPRDGLRLRGKYTLTEQDILDSRQISSTAVHAWWPIERWDISQGPTYAYPAVGKHYDIPPDALRSATIKNLFAAGTCLSATATAAASSRASGICLATGEAAGWLACQEISYP